MVSFLILAMITVVTVGVLVLASNPDRLTNRMFSITALLFTATLFCVYQAIKEGELRAQGGVADPILWVRANGAIHAFIPGALRLLRESILWPSADWRALLSRCLPWFVYACSVAALTATDLYIPPDSTATDQKRGIAYWAMSISLFSIHFAFIVQTWFRIPTLKGIRRIELQFLVFNMGLGTLLCVGLAITGNLLKLSILKHASLVAATGLVVFSAWSICYHRIFDVRQAITSLVHRLVVIAAITILAVLLINILQRAIPLPAALLLAVGAVCLSAASVETKSRDWFGLNNERVLAQMRNSAIEAARTEPKTESLAARFEAQLVEDTGASFVTVNPESTDEYRAGSLSFTGEPAAYSALCELGWATPETLSRRRSTPAIDSLRNFLSEKGLGLIIAVPRGSPAPALIIALGTKTTEWPFTYPEIERLQNVAELMDNILTRSRLTEQAALQAKMEHLAMMSRGLAHDLKNLITPVSSFLVHTDHSFEPNSPAAEVHAAARRSVRIMNDYVRESLFFSERLAPKFELVDLARLFEAVRETTAPQAQRRGITIALRLEFTPPIVADAVLLQRMLANFVGNAIDASRPGKSVTLVASTPCDGWTHLQVIDEGCGIAPEHLGRVFDAYFTTKEFGDDVRGFGLGLSIAQKIADLHCGIINIESQVDIGTTITVELPVTQPTRLETRRLIAGAATP